MINSGQSNECKDVISNWNQKTISLSLQLMPLTGIAITIIYCVMQVWMTVISFHFRPHLFTSRMTKHITESFDFSFINGLWTSNCPLYAMVFTGFGIYNYVLIIQIFVEIVIWL